MEAQKRLPSREITLETKDGEFFFFKADILSNQITYSSDKNIPANLVTISGRRAFEIIGLNRRGIKPDSLIEETHRSEPKKPVDLLEQESLTRFDRNRKGKSGSDGNGGENSNNSRNKRKKKSGNGRPQGGEQQGAPQSNNQREQSRQDRQPRQKQDRQAPKQGEQQQGERQQRNNNNRRPPRNNKPKLTNQLKNRNLCLKGIILLFVASLLSACDKQTVYHSFQSLPTEGWLREDTLSFDVKVTDSLTYYKLSLEVRNRSNYPYQNLPLSICYTTADSIPSPTDTIQLILADKEGIWKGDGWGGLYQTAVSAGSVRIGKPGTYLFKVAYTLPDERLQGINDIGIKLKR